MKRYWLSCLVLFIGSLLTIAAYVASLHFEKHEQYHQFASLAKRDALLVQEQLDISLELSKSLRTFIKAAPGLSAKTFAQFTSPTLRAHPELNAFAWAPKITTKQVPQFQRMAQKAFPNYRLHPKRKQQASSNVYYPVFFLAPLNHQRLPLGFDLSSNATLYNALKQARDSGEAAIAPFKSDSHGTYLLILPTYQQANPHSVYERRQQNLGFLLAAFNLQAMLDTLLNNYNNQQITLAFREISPSEAQPFKKQCCSDRQRYYHVMSLAQKKWLITLTRPQTGFLAEHGGPLLIAALCALLTVLLAAVLASLIRSNLRSEKIIAEKTATLRETNKLLKAIESIQSDFIGGHNINLIFEEILQKVLDLTCSEYGFIAEVLENKAGQKYMRTFAISNIAWNYETRKFYEENAPKGLEFHNLNTLFGRVITTEDVVIANDPAHDGRAGGTPEGHPALSSFLGIPLHANYQLVGMIGVANHSEGYSNAILSFLKPLLITCGTLIFEHRIQRERSMVERENFTRAHYDTLTGISNRFSFEQDLIRMGEISKRKHVRSALLYIDLDNFKFANDELGHDAGDKILEKIGRILSRNIRTSDIAARIGGDEFAIILYHIKDKKEPATVAAKLLEHLKEPVELAMGITVDIGMSIGIALFPDDTDNIETLKSMADKAMYYTKKSGRGHYTFYSELTRESK